MYVKMLMTVVSCTRTRTRSGGDGSSPPSPAIENLISDSFDRTPPLHFIVPRLASRHWKKIEGWVTITSPGHEHLNLHKKTPQRITKIRNKKKQKENE